MSKTSSLFHIVFSTRYRLSAIPSSAEKDVYAFVWCCVKNKNSRLIRIGGIGDHIHLLVNLNPCVALADFVRHIKAKSSGWMKIDGRFPIFKGWGEGYYACSISPEVTENVISYINNQKTHHKVTGFDDEMKSLCHYANLEYNEGDTAQ